MNLCSLFLMVGSLLLATAPDQSPPNSAENSATSAENPADANNQPVALSKDATNKPIEPNAPPPSTWDLSQSDTQPVAEHEGVTLGMQALKTLLGLGIVLALLFLSSRLVAKRLGTTRWQSKAGRLKVDDFMLLDGKTGVYIVVVDGVDWLITTGPHGTAMQPKESSRRSFRLSNSDDMQAEAPLDLASGSLIESEKGENE